MSPLRKAYIQARQLEDWEIEDAEFLIFAESSVGTSSVTIKQLLEKLRIELRKEIKHKKCSCGVQRRQTNDQL